MEEIIEYSQIYTKQEPQSPVNPSLEDNVETSKAFDESMAMAAFTEPAETEYSQMFTQQEPQSPGKPSSEDKAETLPAYDGTVAMANYTEPAELHNVDEKVKSMMKFCGNRASNKKRMSMCKVCGKEATWSGIRNHIETNHITGVSYACDICGIVVSKSRKGVGRHKARAHVNLKLFTEQVI